MKRRRWILVESLIILVLTGTSSFSFAQDKGKKAKNTSVNFEDQLIEGRAQKPELFYLLQSRQANYKRLIRLREDFLPEMRKTGEEITRKGSGN